MRKKTILFFVLNLFLLTSCKNNSNAENIIKVAGSTSVSPVIRSIKESFEEKNLDYEVEIQETGSTSGISSIVEGAANIGMSSRDLTEEELSQGLEEIIIAYDCMVVIINNENKIVSLTTEEITKIFTGEINNWNQIGGDNEEIIIVSREEGSGTRTSFEEILNLEKKIKRNGKEYKTSIISDKAIFENSTGSIKTTISQTKNAIGYISLGSLDNKVKALNINNVEPNQTNILNDTYPIYRPFIFVIKSEEKNNPFLKYVLSEEGQNIVSEKSYIRIDSKK